MALIELKKKLPEEEGTYKCVMKDGSEKELILRIESDWDENELNHHHWYHWFETEQDLETWSPLDEEDEPIYWNDNK